MALGERQIRGGGLSLGTEEFDRAAASMRSFGLKLLSDLLEGGRGLKPREWFGNRDSLLFDRVPFRRLYRWRRLLNFFAPVQSSSQNAFSLVRQARFHGNAAKIIPVLLSRLGIAWHGADGYTIPDRLFELLGRAAWTDPGFQLDAVTILTNHLRNRLLVAATDLPEPRLRPQTIWLIAAAAPLRGRLLSRLTSRRSRRSIARLKKISENLAFNGVPADAEGGQHDFWFQWIAWHIWRNRAPAKRHDALMLHLAALPFISGGPFGSDDVLDHARSLQAIYSKWYPENKESQSV